MNEFIKSLKVEDNSNKKVQLTRLRNVVKAEIKHITESDLHTADEKLEQLDVLHNIYKILNNYNELKPVLQRYFAEKAEKNKWER